MGETTNDRAGDGVYDVVVVGGGAGGLNAALVLARARRRVAVVDAGTPRNAAASHMQGFLSRDGMAPAALLEVGRAEVAGYGVTLIEGQVGHIDHGYDVHLGSGLALRARRVVVATGLCDELPEIPGVRERWGRDLLHCPYCHGYEVRDEPIGVLGTHPGAVEHALLLRQWSDDIVFFPHTMDLTDDECERLSARGVRVADGTVERLVVDDDRVRGVELAEDRVIPRRAVFVFPRMVPRDALLTALGCERDENGWVSTDRSGRTSVFGVWAVGNVADPRAQVVIAAAMGSAAAAAINKDLVDEEVERAVEDHRVASRDRPATPMNPAEIDTSLGDPDRRQTDTAPAHPMHAGDRGADFSPLAPSERLADWRLALAYEAAGGVLAVLPGSPAELAARCNLDEGALRAVLGLLAAWGIVATDDHGRYIDGPAAPSPPDGAMLSQHGVWIRRWAALLGKRLHHRTATSDEAPSRPPTDVGLDLLAVVTRRLTRPVLDVCLQRFPQATRVLDLGGGHGEYSLELARRGLRTTMQDLPEVIEIAERHGRLGSTGVELFAGDFFTTLPPGPFDLVLCAAVTNMFDGPSNRALYRRLRAIIAPGGGLAIVSYLRDRNRVAASFGLQMLVATEGGDAHGEEDYRHWLAEAGYRLTQVHELDDSPQSIVLAER